ncbi:MAG: hypothetical protein HUN04_14725 [Desulfobacter sp.]|nr:MAG: hypothetical protein HUN04_14725 [Desulfobacter sp.]
MNRTIIAPLSVLTGILGVVVLAATTHLFSPVVAFIHNWDAITPAGVAACVLFTVAGFWAALKLLHIVCSYFVPRLEEKPGYENGSAPH